MLMRAKFTSSLLVATRRWLLPIVVLSAVLLVGCQSLTRPPSLPSPTLLSPAAAEMTLQATQQLSVQHGDSSRQLLVVLALNPQQLRLSGLSGLGQRLLDIEHDGKSVQSRYYHDMVLPLSAEWIIAQLQLAYWPLAALQQTWREPWQVTATANQRTLYLEGQPLLTVTYQPLSAAHSTTNEQSLPDQAARQHLPSPTEQVVIVHQTMNTTLTVTTLQAQIKSQAKGSASP